ncbi:hypothetical protein O181_025261 [Austropuccinia psidii MF-1]|uniref:Uncharacterized protein n=1 Tax=Austropuccinia psidii MF-1 TaxID=1389203 RepID=A0A9Q3GZD7_9BASI|nr:hypothetical protein [Austropuccinia psidii MF-1]
MTRPLAGGHELLITHQVFSGLGEHHRALHRLESIVFQRKIKRRNEWLKNQSILSVDQNKELEITPDLEKEGPVVSTSPKPAPELPKNKSKRPQKKQRHPEINQGKANWERT